MELCQPNLFQKDLDVTWWEVIDLLRDLLNSDSFLSTSIITERNNLINEFSEIIANRKINKNILKQTNKVLICEAADTLETLEFS